MHREWAQELLNDGSWRQWVIDEARSWKGTPYHHTGRVKNVGVDCGGLLYEVYAQLFVLRPFPKDYAQDWALHRGEELYLNSIGKYVEQVKNPAPGGFGLFKVARAFSHAAIVCEGGKSFIHAWGRNRSGCVIESTSKFFSLASKQREVKWFDVKPAFMRKNI